MLRRPGTGLTIKGRSVLDLGKLYRQADLQKQVLALRSKYAATVEGINNVCNLYAKEHPEILGRIKSLKQDIRNMTQGMGVAYTIDASTTELKASTVNSESEQLYVANMVLLKSAYRKVAALTHPDKGGDDKLFAAVNAAYRNKDLVYLQQLYINLVQGKDLFWLQDGGLAYVEQEMERPKVSMTMLQQSPLFHVARLHATGNKVACSEGVLHYLRRVELQLINELEGLKHKQFNNNQPQHPLEGVPSW